MDKFKKQADYVMSEKCDKWAYILIILVYIYFIAQIVRWVS